MIRITSIVNNNKFGKTIPFLLILLFSLNLQAITTELKTKKKKKVSTNLVKSWNLAINGGLTMNSGNATSNLINGGSNFRAQLKPFNYATTLDVFYGRSKKQVILNKGKWTNNFSKKLGPALNIHSSINLEYDKFSNIDLRSSLGLGIQFVISNVNVNRSVIVASLSSEFLKASNNNNIKTIRLNLKYNTQRQFSKTTKFSFDALLTPNVTDLFGDFRLYTQISLAVLMTKPVWLNIKFIDRYTNQPVAAHIKKNDLTLVTSIQFSI